MKNSPEWVSRSPDAGSLDERLRRRPGTVYNFTEQLFAVIEELSRIYGSSDPIIDFDQIVPGTESVELVSQSLLAKCEQRMDERTFLVFCRVNAPRIRDYICKRVEAEVWPLDPDELLNDLYLAVYQHVHRLGDPDCVRPAGPLADGPDEAATHYHVLTAEVELIMRERIGHFQSAQLPLPGLPTARSQPPDFALQLTSEVTKDQGWQLREDELEAWTSFALLRMHRDQRRVLVLREVDDLPMKALASKLGCSSFEAAQQLKEAHALLRSEVVRLVRSFSVGGVSDGQQASGSLPEKSGAEEEGDD